jgi:hypothetical protein
MIENALRIISFRNKLTHEYVKVVNTLFWGVIKSSSRYEQPALPWLPTRALDHSDFESLFYDLASWM